MKGVSFIGYSSSIWLMFCGITMLESPAWAGDFGDEFYNPVTTIPCKGNNELDASQDATPSSTDSNPTLRSVQFADLSHNRARTWGFKLHAFLWFSKQKPGFFNCGRPIDLRREQDSIQQFNEELVKRFLTDPNEDTGAHVTQYTFIPKVESDGTLVLQIVEKVIQEVQIFDCFGKVNHDEKILLDPREPLPLRGYKPDTLIRRELGFGSGDRLPSDEVHSQALERVMNLGLFWNTSFFIAPGQKPDKITYVICVIQKNEAQLTFEEAQQIESDGSAESLRQALAKYKEALLLFQQFQNTPENTDTTTTGNVKKLPFLYWQMGSIIWNESSETDALTRLAAAYKSLGEIYQALHYYQQALSVLRDAEDKDKNKNKEASVVTAIASIYDSLGEQQQASLYYEQALSLHLANFQNKLAQRTQQPAQESVQKKEPQPGNGEIIIEINLTEEIRSAAQDARSEGNLAQAAFLTLGEARQYYRQHDFPQTIQRLNEALQLFQTANLPAKEAETLTYLATVHNQLATVHNKPQQRQQALQYYEQALALWNTVRYRQDENGNRPFVPSNDQATRLQEIANLYQRLGQLQPALDYLTQALLTSGQVPPTQLEAERLVHMGYLYNQLSQPQQALHHYNQALQFLRATEHQAGEAETLFFIASVYYFSLNNPQQALEHLNQAQSIWQAIKSPADEAKVLVIKSWIYNQQEQIPEAIKSLELAIPLFRVAGDRLGELKASLLQGFSYERQGNTAQAINLYQQTIDVIESLRGDIKLDDLKVAFIAQQINVYHHLIDILWSTGNVSEAFSYVQRAKARAFLDQMAGARINLRAGATPELIEREQALNSSITRLRQQLVKLREESGQQEKIEQIHQQLTSVEAEYEALLTQLQVSNPEAASLKSVEVSSLAEIQSLLDPDTTLVEYYVTPGRTLAFILTQDTFNTVTLDVSQQELTDAIQAFRRSYGEDDSSNQHPRASIAVIPNFNSENGSINQHSQELQHLHQWLIAPLQPYLKTHTISIVPHSSLHYLPFAALTNGEKYLSDEYALFYLPSSSVLSFLQHKRKPNTNTLLALGNPDTTEPPLKYAQREAEAIAALYQTTALVGRDATEKAVWERAGEAEIVHLAAHGWYNPKNPLFSNLFLAGNIQAEDTHTDGRLEVREVYELNLKATNLVVLSACQTQLGELSNGDEVVGLTRAFMYAGTPSVLASLWKVDDEATGLLMERFYVHLKAGMGKAEALRQAQIELRQASPKYDHPYYWAAFTLTGDSAH